MKWVVAVIVSLALIGGAVWVAAQRPPSRDMSECVEGIVPLHETETAVYYVTVFKCPKPNA